MMFRGLQYCECDDAQSNAKNKSILMRFVEKQWNSNDMQL